MIEVADSVQYQVKVPAYGPGFRISSGPLQQYNQIGHPDAASDPIAGGWTDLLK